MIKIWQSNKNCGAFLVPRGTSSKNAKTAIHRKMMASHKYVDGVPVWFGGHVGPFTIYNYEVWY